MSPSSTLVPHSIPRLNGATTGLLGSRRTLRDNSVPPLVQTKLTLSQPGDKFEQEADRVADEIMRSPDPFGGAMPGGDPPDIQKKCATCTNDGSLCPKCAAEEKKLQLKPISSSITPVIQRQTIEPEEEEGLLQRKETSGTFSRLGSNLTSRIKSLTYRGGKPLPESERTFFEPRFGYNFSKVRIFSDSPAADTARDINARAFTVGNNVAFGHGQYMPKTNEGRRLLAHELTHVVQQGAAPQFARPTEGLFSPTPKLGRLASQALHLQRTTADPLLAPAMPCTVDASPGHTVGTDIMFGSEDKTLDPTDIAAVTAFHTIWLGGGGIDSIIIDGFSSIDGPQTFNWQLSCDRAEAVKAALFGLGVPAGMIATVAHGESEEFSTSSRSPNRRAIIHKLPGIVPTVTIFPVIFGSTINRVPPGVGTPVFVLVGGLPAGSTIALDIQGSSGANGTAAVAPVSIAGSSIVTVTGGTQTTPGNANNLTVRAVIGGLTLGTSFGFTVAAHPRDFTVTLNGDINTATAVGLRANNAWTGDGAGGVADLTEVVRSEQVDILTRDNPPFTSAAGTTATTGTSGFIPGTASPTVDTHTYGVASIWRPFWLRLLGNSFTIVYEQLFIFNDLRTGVTNQVVPNSGFTITHALAWNSGRSGWDHQCIKTGAATSVGAFSATAGAGTATSLVHPL